MVELFFLKISRLSNKYYDTYDDLFRQEIMNIFVDLDYNSIELILINYSLIHNYNLYNEFISFTAFKYGYNYEHMRYITDKEKIELDTFKMYDIANYDTIDLFYFYKNKMND